MRERLLAEESAFNTVRRDGRLRKASRTSCGSTFLGRKYGALAKKFYRIGNTRHAQHGALGLGLAGKSLQRLQRLTYIVAWSAEHTCAMLMPVSVCMVGCIEAARCERSVDGPVFLPLTMTISDVRPRGAAISAAICKKSGQKLP